jgi:5-methylcytosine-specific restriction endonuclease McrA
MLSVGRRLAIRNDPCFYCGSPETAHVDHYFPLAKGGSDRWVNLVRTCGPCNNAKYTMCGTAFRLLTGG